MKFETNQLLKLEHCMTAALSIPVLKVIVRN